MVLNMNKADVTHTVQVQQMVFVHLTLAITIDVITASLLITDWFIVIYQ